MIKNLKYYINAELIGKTFLKLSNLIEKRKLKKRQIRKNTLFAPPLISAAYMKYLMSLHYLRGAYTTKKVAWVTSGAPRT